MTSIFTKILNKEIPSDILYENEKIFVIQDINPEEKTHLLIIPKEEIISIQDLNETNSIIIGELVLVAKIMAEKMGVTGGYKLRINVGNYQEVPHIHMHLLSKGG